MVTIRIIAIIAAILAFAIVLASAATMGSRIASERARSILEDDDDG